MQGKQKTAWTRVAVLLLLAILPAAAQERTLWRIGEFDQAGEEFRSWGVDYADPADAPVFYVGRSDPARHWQRFQPGPANGLAGGREHPFTILFDLAEPPRGVYRLRLGIIYETPRLSYLRLEINSRRGVFYFHPQLYYSGGDWANTFVPHSSYAERTIEIPAAWLRQGENRIVLTALDDPSEVEHSLGSIATGHTGLVYDALELTHNATVSYDAARVEVRALPTIFYKDRGGQLVAEVEVYANFARMPRAGELRLEAAGQRLAQSFRSAYDFGEVRAVFDLPEWSGTLEATVLAGRRGALRRFPVMIEAGRKWTVYLVPHAHLDIGFTDHPAKVAELHAQSADDAMRLMHSYPEFRWTLDGSWVAEQYLRGRSDAKQREFLEHLRRERISLPLEYSNQHTATASLEGLARSFYYSHRLARQHHIPVRSTQNVDVPAYTWSYASILAAAGVRYFLGASNQWRAPVLLRGRWNERSPFWWEGPDGGRVLMWYSRAYLQMHTMFGGPARLAAVRDSLPVFLQAYTRADYPARAAILFGSQLENTPLDAAQAAVPRLWQQRYAWPRLVFSSVGEAMEAIERDWTGDFPVIRGDFGPYWEDGFGSDAFHTAVHRRNQQRILNAEKLGSAVAAVAAGPLPDKQVLDDAWRQILLYDEHTWCYVSATTQPFHEQTETQMRLKQALATDAERKISDALQRSWAQLGALVAPSERVLLVFNGLNWTRSGVVTADIEQGREIVDLTSGQPVPYETVWAREPAMPLPNFGGPYQRVRFLAHQVPGMGYRAYAIRPATAAGQQQELPATAETVENRFYRIALDPASGALRSIFDKELGRELVDPASPYRFGAYLYVSGGDDMPRNSLYRFGAGLAPPELTVTPARGTGVRSIRRVPYGTIVTLTATAPHTPWIETQIILHDDRKEIEFRYRFEKEPVLAKEAVYFAFPFAATNPSFTYGNQTGWVNPARDQLAGGSKEWFAATHWAAIEADGFTGILLPADLPLVSFGDIVRGAWPETFAPKSGTIFSWAMNNYWGTNFFPQQGGTFEFRFVVTSRARFDGGETTRLGWEAAAPLESTQHPAEHAAGRLPRPGGQLLAVEGDGLVLTTWKPAEDGEGSILRLVESAGKATRARISSQHLRILQAWRASLLEENAAPLAVVGGAVEADLGPFEILTLRLRTEPVVESAAEE